MRRGKIFIGDLTTAAAALDANDELVGRIAELLGLARAASSRELAEPVPAATLPDVPPLDDSESSGTLTAEEAAKFLPSELRQLPTRSLKLKRFSFGSSATLPTASSEENEPAPPFEPLLRRVTSRAILAHALSTPRVTGIDVERLVGRIARRERIDPLPLRRIATMRRGVQLLVDVSSGMTLFRRDQEALSDWIEKVVGHDRFTFGSFIGTPLLRFFGTTVRARYETPAPQTPVVLLTDLGIGQPPRLDNAASVEQWLAFAELLRRAHCPVIAFVPYPRARWPLPLRRAFTVHEWDRALTASRARRRT